MDPLEVVLSWGGRLPRIPYLLAGIGSLVVFAVLAAVLAFMLGVSGAMTAMSGGVLSPVVILVALLFIALVLAYAYVGINIQVKRLHDMGMSGLHAIWIQAVLIGYQVARQSHSLVAIGVFGLAALGVGGWLLFTPGERGPNRYGLEPY